MAIQAPQPAYVGSGAGSRRSPQQPVFVPLAGLVARRNGRAVKHLRYDRGNLPAARIFKARVENLLQLEIDRIEVRTAKLALNLRCHGCAIRALSGLGSMAVPQLRIT
jgi:hypothetical protein